MARPASAVLRRPFLDSDPPSAFERGIHRLSLLILRLTVFLVLFVLLAHLAFGRPVLESFLFAVALAVGLTPELLPMIMTVTLSRGALRMAKKAVVVKRLAAIHDLGAMDVLCTDKTGTLTEARISLVGCPGPDGVESERVLTLAAINSRFSSGIRARSIRRSSIAAPTIAFSTGRNWMKFHSISSAGRCPFWQRATVSAC